MSAARTLSTPRATAAHTPASSVGEGLSAAIEINETAVELACMRLRQRLARVLAERGYHGDVNLTLSIRNGRIEWHKIGDEQREHHA